MAQIQDHHVTMADDHEAFLASLDYDVPDVEENKAYLQKLLNKKRAEDRAAAERERQRQRNAQRAAELLRDDGSNEALAKMENMRDEMGLDVAAVLEEYQESQQCLFPVATPPQPALTCEPEYMEGVTAALSALGVDPDFLPPGALGQGGPGEGAGLLAEGVRCGYVANEALRRGSAEAPTVDALFQLLSHSPDMEVAGAAFVALLSLLNDPSLPTLMLDAGYGLPSGGSPVYSSLPRPCRVDSLPTIRALYEGLLANGYSPHGQDASGSGAAGTRRGGGKQQQQQQQEEGRRAGEAEEGKALRIQAIKLVLRTAVAVCRYCEQHRGLRGATLDRDALADLLLAVAHMGLDPCERLLLDDLDDATAAVLAAFEEGDWQRKLPQLAGRLSDLADSHIQHHRLLKRLPADGPRGLALQQLSAAMLLEKLIPAKPGASAAHSAVRRRDAALDPCALISAQPWFNNPKGLVEGATSGGHGSIPKGGYHISQLELLLKICNMLLWPHVQRYSEGAIDTPLTPEFLGRWCHAGGFLEKLQKSIKCQHAEDRLVRSTANLLQMEYEKVLSAMRAGE